MDLAGLLDPYAKALHHLLGYSGVVGTLVNTPTFPWSGPTADRRRPCRCDSSLKLFTGLAAPDLLELYRQPDPHLHRWWCRRQATMVGYFAYRPLH